MYVCICRYFIYIYMYIYYVVYIYRFIYIFFNVICMSRDDFQSLIVTYGVWYNMLRLD